MAHNAWTVLPKNTNEDKIQTFNTSTEITKTSEALTHQAKTNRKWIVIGHPTVLCWEPDHIQWCTGPLRLIN